MNLLLILLGVGKSNAAEEFVKLDPYGIGMTVLAMLVVISVLALAAITFQNIDNLIHFFTRLFTKRAARTEKSEKTEKVTTSGDEIAAIALALHLFKSDLHDTESLTLTFNRISRIYSPWSSKIYGIMNKTIKRTPISK
jgi:Na+-transporting methylmalonyl-CoA/oxaloacetate decarboxylase gamma subunit